MKYNQKKLINEKSIMHLFEKDIKNIKTFKIKLTNFFFKIITNLKNKRASLFVINRTINKSSIRLIK